jgi:peptidoglycan/xylan/chitin deacetylase (PgdA/CDA1 family)
LQLDAPELETHPALRILTEEELRNLGTTGSFIFANHTWSHPELPYLGVEEIASEISRCEEWLTRSALPKVPWIAFPRGLFDDRVTDVVTEMGLRAFGAQARQQNMHVHPRVGIYRADAQGWRFWLKTTGDGLVLRNLQ